MRGIIDRTLERLLILIISVMLIAVIWQVISRYLIGTPSTLTDEIASFSLIWLGLFGAAYATGKELHLAIDLISVKTIQKYPTLFSAIVTFSVSIFALFVMVIGGLRLCWITYTLDQRSAALEIPLAYIYLVVPVSGLLIVYYSLDIFVKKRNLAKS
ncbi:TRAP transporter small permease [Aquimarina gracilis]|uniref:TRAP transporter small permease n=1 Tax=Aquimarina gracilis TaxID=874422 RepID=A0ABU5ZSK3_9FLAO|nr:TRAP transporter small permease [Aquimarina gracilis]MEB3344362.1 TRAP transporter small permease [Aquimarina gracilis]